MRICFKDVFFLFFCFLLFPSATKIPDNRSREQVNGFSWNFYQTIVGKMEFASPYPNGARPPNNFLGAKNWKIAIGAYSSELITPERKRISQRLKWLCIRQWPTRCTFELDLWPPEVNTVRAFACKSAKIPGFLAILSKFSAVTPLKLSR